MDRSEPIGSARPAAGRHVRPRTLAECLAPWGDIPTHKLEALESWLADRAESSLCVGAFEGLRRCTVSLQGRAYEGESTVAPGPCGGWWATWCAICAAVAKAEAFERAAGADVG